MNGLCGNEDHHRIGSPLLGTGLNGLGMRRTCLL